MNLRSRLTWVLNSLRKTAHDPDLSTELKSHLQLHIEDNIAHGMTSAEARRQALLKLGGLEQTKEAVRDQRTVPLLESLLQDARFAARLFKKSPGFTAVAMLTLALGIRANTAIFSVTRQVLLQRLPLPHPEQLVLLYSPGPRDGNLSSDESDGSESFSDPMFENLRDHNSAFSGLAGKADFPVSVAFHGNTERASAELVSGHFFSVLGVRPALGRLLEPADASAPGTSPVVLLSYPLLAKTLRRRSLRPQADHPGQQTMTLVGVVQSGFNGI